MPFLDINLTDHILHELTIAAEKAGRSLDEQIIITLEKGLSILERSRQTRIQAIENIIADHEYWEGWDNLDVADFNKTRQR